MLPVGDCPIPEDVCCWSLFDIAQHILSSTYEALLECYPDQLCSTAPLAYVTMGGGDDAILDALTVAIDSVVPSDQSQPNGFMAPVQQMMVGFTIRLVEYGWPTVEEDNGEIMVPDPALQNAIARHAYAHGERLYRKVVSLAANKALVPDSVPGCTSVLVGPLNPLSPLGGQIGWTIGVTLNMAWS